MITRAYITKRADEDGVDARTVERDYIQAHVVSVVARRDSARALIFKGGTALRMCHIPGFRYSADLDYSVVGLRTDEALSVLDSALADLPSELRVSLLQTNDKPSLVYVGPLGRKRTLKLDLADDELVVHTEDRPLGVAYPGLPEQTEIPVYTALEVAAEKLRCVIQRLQCRDLLDLRVLLQDVGVDPHAAAELFGHKARHRALDPATFRDRFEERVLAYKKRWSNELGTYMALPEVPHFEETERVVRRHLRELLRPGR